MESGYGGPLCDLSQRRGFFCAPRLPSLLLGIDGRPSASSSRSDGRLTLDMGPGDTPAPEGGGAMSMSVAFVTPVVHNDVNAWSDYRARRTPPPAVRNTPDAACHDDRGETGRLLSDDALLARYRDSRRAEDFG